MVTRFYVAGVLPAAGMNPVHSFVNIEVVDNSGIGTPRVGALDRRGGSLESLVQRTLRLVECVRYPL